MESKDSDGLGAVGWEREAKMNIPARFRIAPKRNLGAHSGTEMAERESAKLLSVRVAGFPKSSVK